MININIFTETPSRIEFLQQINFEKFPKSEYYFAENSTEDIDWDLVVVYEGVKQPVNFRCKKGNLIFISGAPPMSRVYPKAFLAQFDTLITQHPKLRHPDNRQYQPCMNWHLSLSFKENKYLDGYADYISMKPLQKNKNISMITSSKRMMPGHGRRMKFVEALREQLGNNIELFGQGIKFVDCKTEAINDFRFTISVENSQIPNYWTEKFSDPILAYTVPFYCGCTNIGKYFPEDCYIPIDINNKEKAIAKIKEILANPQKEYDKRLPALIEARNKILDEYNLFAVIDRMFCNQAAEHKDIKNVCIKPSNSFRTYNFLHYRLRLTRLLAKFYINYFK